MLVAFAFQLKGVKGLTVLYYREGLFYYDEPLPVITYHFLKELCSIFSALPV